MTRSKRNYSYFDFTLSLCPDCLRRVDAKIIVQDDQVYMLKTCPEHGRSRTLIATDAAYYQKTRAFLRPGEKPLRFNTEVHLGCPFDCGICSDHEQHGCLTLLELTDRCNLSCPTCYSASGPSAGRHRTMEEIERMLDAIVENEGEPDVVQISGGEPTIHPDFFRVLDLCKTKPIRHLMVNTNGLRIANDPEFARRLAEYKPAFEIYLQFDSLKAEPLLEMRGVDLRETRRKALEVLNELNLSTTLVVTLQKGLNTDEIGEIIDFATKQPCVRGVTFQPTQVAGRLENFDPARDRLTLTEVRSEILRQSSLFTPADLVPVPCNPDSLAMAYALKLGGEVTPLSRFVEPEALLAGAGDTIVFERDDSLKAAVFRLFSLSAQKEEGTPPDLYKLLCCLPSFAAPGLSYDNVFRVIIMQFLDPWNFDVRAVKRSCVHIARPDGMIIPFDTMNIFYRAGQEARLEAAAART